MLDRVGRSCGCTGCTSSPPPPWASRGALAVRAQLDVRSEARVVVCRTRNGVHAAWRSPSERGGLAGLLQHVLRLVHDCFMTRSTPGRAPHLQGSAPAGPTAEAGAKGAGTAARDARTRIPIRRCRTMNPTGKSRPPSGAQRVARSAPGGTCGQPRSHATGACPSAAPAPEGWSTGVWKIHGWLPAQARLCRRQGYADNAPARRRTCA